MGYLNLLERRIRIPQAINDSCFVNFQLISTNMSCNGLGITTQFNSAISNSQEKTKNSLKLGNSSK